MHEEVEDIAMLYIVYLLGTVVFPQTNGRCSDMLCDMLKDLAINGRYNLVHFIHSILVSYMRLVVVFVRIRAVGVQAHMEITYAATWIWQLWITNITILCRVINV